jgi:hypothetical protein
MLFSAFLVFIKYKQDSFCTCNVHRSGHSDKFYLAKKYHFK